MKTTSTITLAIALLASGCAHVPQDAAQRLAQAQARFKDVKQGMTKEELVATLGPPQKEDARRCCWEIGYGWWNRESLVVDFDAAGKVLTTAIGHREANRPSVSAM